jgi:chromosome transmission fidelity protein 1
LAGKKKLHREPKEARDLDAVLSLYASDAKRRVAESGTPAGALLLCVIGGKMSEGINFADDMARGVVVAGLPFPDLTDPELKEKMEHLDRAYGAGKDAALARSIGGGVGGGGVEDGITGQAYYFNLCMRAVNQSVGRAIRHAKDYAAIVLCDCRYVNDKKVWNALPEWIKGGGGFGGGKGENVPFGKIVLGLRQFFKDREGV